MRPGLPASVVLHVALIAWIVVGLPWKRTMEDAVVVDAMPIEFVPVADVANLRLGQKTAKPKDEITPKETKQAAQESEGARAGTDKLEEPPPPIPAAKPEPPKPEPVKPEPVKLPEPKPEPPKPEPVKAPEPKPQPKPDIESSEPKAKPQPAKPAEQASSKFNPSDIQKLLQSKEKAQNAASTGHEVSRTASAGTRTGAGTSNTNAPKLSMAQRDAIGRLLKEQIQRCFAAPPGAEQASQLAVVRMELSPDGSLSAAPKVVSSSNDPAFRSFAESLRRAVLRCAPYHIPAQYTPFMEDWRILNIEADSQDFSG